MRLKIRKLRQSAHLTLEQLAEKAGISRSYLNELELGAKTINALRLEQVAKALNVSTTELFEAEIIPTPIVGRVGAGAKVPLHDVTDQGGHFSVRRPPQLIGLDVVAVEVVGDSMSPMYEPGSVLFYARSNHEGVPEDDIGLPCIVEDAGGMAWVKQLRRGSAPGLWNLISLNPTADNMWDVSVKWAARVRLALPRDLIDRI